MNRCPAHLLRALPGRFLVYSADSNGRHEFIDRTAQGQAHRACARKALTRFKNKFTPTETCKQARDNYAEGREVAVAGRITAHREMGKSMFIDVRDQSGRLQIYAQKNHARRNRAGQLGHIHASRPRRFHRRARKIVHHQDRRNLHQARFVRHSRQSPAPAAREMARA